jgi:predicted GH43/DUF377 family glycosyl hydrolase
MWLLLFFAISLYGQQDDDLFSSNQNIVLAAQRIRLHEFPEAFNPSLIQFDGKLLLTFRNFPDLKNQWWLSETGIVLLDELFRPITTPQILSFRAKRSKTPCQAEDVRLFTFRDKLFVIYNDNTDEIFYDQWRRRDMFMAELLAEKSSNALLHWDFKIGTITKLVCEEKYPHVLQQKNWIPFEWKNSLFFTYSIHPHEILAPNPRNGSCYSFYKTEAPIQWDYGHLRGSSAAQLVDGEYLAFFHSGVPLRTAASGFWTLWHYFAGAYTFSATPPFEITRISAKPIMSDWFYTDPYRIKQVIFPGGFVVKGPHIYMAYGKDDCEMWIATLDKAKLLQSLVPVKK